MIKFEKEYVSGWEAAVRGMRNPLDSWEKSDSVLYPVTENGCKTCPKRYDICTELQPTNNGCFELGENDLKLMRSLAKAGPDHAKFARMLVVTVDITAPLYWWKEFDTYKVGTVANSCSTMHKIMERDFTEEDFSFDYMKLLDNGWIEQTIYLLNLLRDNYVNFEKYFAEGEVLEGVTKKGVWYTLIQALPSSYNQRRTVQMSYQNAWHMRGGRKGHKLDEWHRFCDWADGLPYFKEIFLIRDHEEEQRMADITRELKEMLSHDEGAEQ